MSFVRTLQPALRLSARNFSCGTPHAAVDAPERVAPNLAAADALPPLPGAPAGKVAAIKAAPVLNSTTAVGKCWLPLSPPPSRSKR